MDTIIAEMIQPLREGDPDHVVKINRGGDFIYIASVVFKSSSVASDFHLLYPFHIEVDTGLGDRIAVKGGVSFKLKKSFNSFNIINSYRGIDFDVNIIVGYGDYFDYSSILTINSQLSLFENLSPFLSITRAISRAPYHFIPISKAAIVMDAITFS